MEFFNVYLNLKKFFTFRQRNLTTVMYTYEKFPNRHLQLVKQPSFRRPVKPHSVQAMFTARPPLSKHKTCQEFEFAQWIIVVFSIKSGKHEIPQNSECKVQSLHCFKGRFLLLFFFSSFVLLCLFVCCFLEGRTLYLVGDCIRK